MSRRRNLRPRAPSAPQWPAIPGALSGPPLPSAAFGRRGRQPRQRDGGPSRARHPLVAPWVLVLVFFVVLVGLVSLIVAVAA